MICKRPGGWPDGVGIRLPERRHGATVLAMKPSDALQKHRGELRNIVARYGALRPRIFGSAAAGTDTETSDLDLLVDPTPATTLMTLTAIQLEAESLLGIHVDVLTPKSLPRKFRDQILRTAVAL